MNTNLFFTTVLVLASYFPAQAQTLSMEQCLPLLQRAELEPNPAIYDQCGFNDVTIATTQWPPILEENKVAHALYEICVRHPKQPQSQAYCMMAAKLGDGPAVAWAGDIYFKKNQIPKAISYYNYALQRGGLPIERESQIITQMALLYVRPDSPYYNPTEAIPLLQKASQQRSALANNMMGYFTFAGLYGIPQDDKEAFTYFWRAILLGCPAAEENLGLFQLATQQKELDKKTALNLMSQRIFSCEASKKKELTVGDLTIKLYHLSFTPQECADLNYYAERLIDTNLPFTGKDKCAFSKDLSQISQFLNNRQP
ncbi:MAG: sel1 repeat family protein [Alphaproteobacteria bacterium]|nr:sel1 repeat family protein [Alphaproteobacteria bacterium]